MSDQARYFRVGAFVLGGIALALLCVVLLGGGSLLQRPLVVETVFDESVQGLDEGSPVKLRGVKIGAVSHIGFAGEFYDLSATDDPVTYGNRVLVRMDIVIDGQSPDRAQQEKDLAALIDKGLRVQLSPLGITGTFFIQADYLDPERYPPPALAWKPDHLYIPAAPSTITQLSGAADRLLTRINKLDVERLLTNLDTLLVNVNQVVTRADLAGVQKSLAALLDDARLTSAELRRAVQQAGIGSLYTDAKKALTQLSAALTRMRQLSDTGGEDLGTALENLRVASENLRDASETARSYPSLLLFGQPPAKPPKTPAATPDAKR
jgi:phospholipid/cholesterol/gamma-HCH transport system substrate-binding protein/paraquat-inducible protein B